MTSALPHQEDVLTHAGVYVFIYCWNCTQDSANGFTVNNQLQQTRPWCRKSPVFTSFSFSPDSPRLRKQKALMELFSVPSFLVQPFINSTHKYSNFIKWHFGNADLVVWQVFLSSNVNKTPEWGHTPAVVPLFCYKKAQWCTLVVKKHHC